MEKRLQLILRHFVESIKGPALDFFGVFSQLGGPLRLQGGSGTFTDSFIPSTKPCPSGAYILFVLSLLYQFTDYLIMLG